MVFETSNMDGIMVVSFANDNPTIVTVNFKNYIEERIQKVIKKMISCCKANKLSLSMWKTVMLTAKRRIWKYAAIHHDIFSANMTENSKLLIVNNFVKLFLSFITGLFTQSTQTLEQVYERILVSTTNYGTIELNILQIIFSME